MAQALIKDFGQGLHVSQGKVETGRKFAFSCIINIKWWTTSEILGGDKVAGGSGGGGQEMSRGCNTPGHVLTCSFLKRLRSRASMRLECHPTITYLYVCSTSPLSFMLMSSQHASRYTHWAKRLSNYFCKYNSITSLSFWISLQGIITQCRLPILSILWGSFLSLSCCEGR